MTLREITEHCVHVAIRLCVTQVKFSNLSIKILKKTQLYFLKTLNNVITLNNVMVLWPFVLCAASTFLL